MKNLHIYIRVSSKDQLEGFSPETQREAGLKKAKELGLKPVLVEEGVNSAKHETIEQRPKLHELLQKADNGLVENLFVIHSDRLSRDDVVTAIIKKNLKKNGVLIYTPRNMYDLTDLNQYALFGIEEVFNQWDNDKRRLKSSDGMVTAAKEGVWLSRPPYGYDKGKDKKLVVNPQEAKVYRRIVNMALDGITAGKIAIQLNKEGIPPKGRGHKWETRINKYTGKNTAKEPSKLLWQQGTLYKMLRNETYTGLHVSSIGIEIPAPKLIEQKDWDTLQKVIKRNAKKTFNQNKTFYLMRGMLNCKRCGATVSGHRDHHYICYSRRKPTPYDEVRCNLPSINISVLDNQLWSIFVKLFVKNEGIEREYRKQFIDNDSIDKLQKSMTTLKNQVDKYSRKKAEVFNLFREDIISKPEFVAERRKCDDEIAKLEPTIRELEVTLKNSTESESLYKDFLAYVEQMNYVRNITDKNEQRELLLRYVEHVLVDYIEDKKAHEIEVKFKIPLFPVNPEMIDGFKTTGGFYVKQFKDTGTQVIDDKTLINVVETPLHPKTDIPIKDYETKACSGDNSKVVRSPYIGNNKVSLREKGQTG